MSSDKLPSAFNMFICIVLVLTSGTTMVSANNIRKSGELLNTEIIV